MKEFRPWSKATYDYAIQKYRNGRLSILDIQLSGKCNYNCIYCDSPNRNSACKINFDHFEKLVRQESNLYDWMFICGLGEPLWAENKTRFLRLMALCAEMNIKCSIFTNGSQIDDTILGYIQMGILYPIIKIDTFSLEKSNSIYGTKEAQKTLDAIGKLFEMAQSMDDDYCHVAASVVPTTKNETEMINIVEQCCKSNVFPLLGQLEYAGNAVKEYDNLLLSKNELLELRANISLALGEEYRVPICPSVIAGIHVANDGFVSVDEKSGLSCSWFWLETPQTIKLCDINVINSLKQADEEIRKYRQSIFGQFSTLVEKIEEHPFGGCGGNVKYLALSYLELQSSLNID